MFKRVFEFSLACLELVIPSPKRLFDFIVAGCGLLILCPVLLIIAVLVKIHDGGPVFFRQIRLGQGVRPFQMLKFRSMVVDASKSGVSITKGGDLRITRLGRWLRKTKLDELPQLWNVLVGDMSFVGPRPEVPKYVDHYTREQRLVLLLKPGITDLATLIYRNEEELLRGVKDVEDYYIREVMPRKIEINFLYAERASLWEDIKIILRTVFPGLPLRSAAEVAGLLPSEPSQPRIRSETMSARPNGLSHRSRG